MSATPLHLACQAGYDQAQPDLELAVRLTDIVATLLGAKASVDQGDERGQTALYIACHLSHRGIVKLLSPTAPAAPSFAGPPYDTAENIAASKGHRKLAVDLVRSRHWTALHHVTILTYKRLDLLRGANILATARVDGPTPPAAQAAAAQRGEGHDWGGASDPRGGEAGAARRTFSGAGARAPSSRCSSASCCRARSASAHGLRRWSTRG